MDDPSTLSFPMKHADGTDYLYYLTTKGYSLLEKMNTQGDACDQDLHGLYINNDFTGYGLVEVLENGIALWEKEWVKKTRKAEALWSCAEVIAVWINDGDIRWHMIDDGDRLAGLCWLMAALFLETFRALWKDHLIAPESPIKNIGMIAGLVALGNNDNCITDYSYIYRIVGMCKKGGVEVRLGHDDIEMEGRIEEFLNKEEAKYKVDDEDEWRDEDDEEDEILKGYDAVRDGYDEHLPTGKLGGREYDITKMSKAEKQEASLGGGGLMFDSDDELEFV
ncbi:hypothetical protein K440DRAFT_663178 [Wilcoxina mikolae CBS 423.85]|nr:hypothetical protein K440DRAFT_663178 [Wilcoxina mikolae CBS 423.85]